jgi:actin
MRLRNEWMCVSIIDGKEIGYGNERFRCGEVLFQPNFIGAQDPGIHEMVYNAINKGDLDIRAELYSNIVLGGGNTMWDGISERLLHEMKVLSGSARRPPKHIGVIAEIDRRHSAWIGGSILASLPEFQHMVVTKQEYDERGPTAIHSKCF